MVKVIVSGACGRMGRAVLNAVYQDPELELVGAVDLNAGADAGELIGIGKIGVIDGCGRNGQNPCPRRYPYDAGHSARGTLGGARASGGIGRRARFRSVCPKGRGGSTPPARTGRKGLESNDSSPFALSKTYEM